jgi:carbon storage regulator
MLVLTRRVGERIVIGDDVEVEVVGILDGRVRLGIVAPRAVSVDREEVRDEKRAAAGRLAR